MSGGSPFQTFFLLFKSNAKETKKDMQDLQDVSDKTRKKIKDAKEETNELGKAFTDAVESGMRALAAYASFNAFKSGIVNAQEFNRTLNIQTKLWGQSANEINAYGSAVKSAGGDLQGFLGWYDKIRQENAAAGQKTLPVGGLMQHIRDQVRGLSPEVAQDIFQRYGLGDIGAQSLLMGSEEEYQKAIAQGMELAKNTELGSEAAIKFGNSWDNLVKSLEKFWTTVNTVILPPLGALFDALTQMFSFLADNKVLATSFFITMAGAALYFTATIPAIVAGFGAISTAALAAAAPMAAFLGKLAAVAAVAGAVGTGAVEGGEAIGRWANRQLGRGDANGILRGKPGYNSGAGGGSAMSYLMNKHGLDAGHAAAIWANAMHESSGRPGIHHMDTDNKMHYGLFQWSPERAELIRKGIGIDVRTAGRNDQIDAMMWELEKRKQLSGFKAASSPGEAAMYFGKKFEVHGGGMAESMRRAQTAMEIAGSTPFASQNFTSGGSVGGNNITIGKIDVNTQATDASGIASALRNELQREIGGLHAQNNDAIAY